MLSVEQRILQFNEDRVPAYVKFKYRKMKENPFVFFRGSCHLFYEDIATRASLPPAPVSWICGDLHIENFGSYKGDNRLVYFDINDFDESILAPVTWEITRLLTSILVAADTLQIMEKEAIKCCNDMLAAYSHTLATAKAVYVEEATANGVIKTFLKKVSGRRHRHILKDRTEWKSGKLKLKTDKLRLFRLDKTLKTDLVGTLQKWIDHSADRRFRYTVEDAAFRIAGTGSIGQKRYAFLLQNKQRPGRYLLLDMKKTPASSLAPYLSGTQPAWQNESQRVATVQNWMQNISPALMAPYRYQNEWYLLRELQPTDDKLDFSLLAERFDDFNEAIMHMGILAASAQLRSTGRKGACSADELSNLGTQQGWQQSLLNYAHTYSRKVKDDFNEYVASSPI